MDFHPGAVFGRVAVAYAKNPGVFDRASLRLMKFAVSVLEDKEDRIRAEDTRRQQQPLTRGKRKPLAEASANKGIPARPADKAALGIRKGSTA
jgi:hypothetical protein